MRKVIMVFSVAGYVFLNSFLIIAHCADPAIYVDIYIPDKAYNGTTLLPDHHDPQKTRVIEIDMKGDIVWEYVLPANLRRYTNPGFDAELLPNNNVLIVLPKKGVCEINRSGDMVWSHWDSKISHDADRLPNGNTIYVFGDDDRIDDAQVKEVDPQGKIVWRWYAKNHFSTAEYQNIYSQGWTHINAVTRLANGNTLVSLRNFNCLAEVDPRGDVVKVIDKDFLEGQHDPEVLASGNILLANHGNPQEALEIDKDTGEVIWRFPVFKRQSWPLRDADRLPNGNTLITGSTMILEVTPEQQVVWRVCMKDSIISGPRESASKGFFKAQRLTAY
ncbi:MAG: aryl-sulfate sulfotransferase [Candidatus Omnitrophica bacterium]|nr:aryl-sulfate sulfotransferase [Candidatus Omnitrophota bacterium]